MCDCSEEQLIIKKLFIDKTKKWICQICPYCHTFIGKLDLTDRPIVRCDKCKNELN